MKNLKEYDLIWWITNSIQIILMIGVVILTNIYRNVLYGGKQTIFELLMTMVGVFVTYTMFCYFLDKGIVRLRKIIRKSRTKRNNNYTDEEIEKIKEQMKHSTDHLK